MVEHSAVNRVVVGSSPTRGVIRMDIGQQDNCSNSFLYFFIRLHGQAVKTPPFHGGIRGSNPLGVIEQNIKGIQKRRLGSMAEQLICNQQVVGSTPTVGFLDLQLSWLEQPAHNRSVLGSSPRRSICSTRYGLVAQLVRAPPCHGGGRGFEPHPGRCYRHDSNNLQYTKPVWRNWQTHRT